MTSAVYVGDTYPFVVTLKVGGVPFSITTGSETVTAVWLNFSTLATLCVATAQVSTTSGADWLNGIVAITFPAVEADKLSAVAGQSAILEIQVTKTIGKQTFQAVYAVKSGIIP